MSNFTDVSFLNTVFGNQKGNPKNLDWTAIRKQLHLIQEEVTELVEGVESSDVSEMRDAVADILVVTYGMAHIMGIDADKDMAAVQASNMSKLCTTEDEVAATMVYYTETIGIEVYPAGELSKIAIKSLKDQKGNDGKFYPQGKFLKNTNWHEPIFA